MADLWRSGMALGSAGIGMPGLEATGIANDTIGRMLDPVSLSLMGGNRVGEAIRRLTEGPRFADVGSIERDMAEVMELYLQVQTAARSYEGVVARAWMEVNQRFAADLSKRFAKDGQVLPAKEALKIWLDIANETLMRDASTPELSSRPSGNCFGPGWTSCSRNESWWNSWSSRPDCRRARRWMSCTTQFRHSSDGSARSRRIGAAEAPTIVSE